jgi:hypothetical protein
MIASPTFCPVMEPGALTTRRVCGLTRGALASRPTHALVRLVHHHMIAILWCRGSLPNHLGA